MCLVDLFFFQTFTRWIFALEKTNFKFLNTSKKSTVRNIIQRTRTPSTFIYKLKWLLNLLNASNVLNVCCRKNITEIRGGMVRLHRFNALVKARVEIPAEGASCAERVGPCDHTSKFRTISSWCNNLDHPSWGSAQRIYGRIVDSSYSNGLDEPRNTSVSESPLPSPREVQNSVVVDLDRPHPRYSVREFSFYYQNTTKHLWKIKLK